MSPSEHHNMVPRLISYCQFCARPFQWAEGYEGMGRITCKECMEGYNAIMEATRNLANKANHRAVRKILVLVKSLF